MVDIEFLGQLIDSMEQAVLKLEVALDEKKSDEVNKLRIFIFDLHRQIDAVIVRDGNEV